MKLKIKPALGLKIRDPQTLALLPEDGKEVEQSSFWIRRIQAGDVLLIDDKKPIGEISESNPEFPAEQKKTKKNK